MTIILTNDNNEVKVISENMTMENGLEVLQELHQYIQDSDCYYMLVTDGTYTENNKNLKAY